MLKKERDINIISLLKRNTSMSMKQLSDDLEVSENTIRRDLYRLAQLGMIDRVRGGAVIKNGKTSNDDLDWLVRQNQFTEEKTKIGKKCAELVEEGDSVILDAGTTIMEIAKNLHSKHNIMVLTNAVNISMELSDNSHITVVLTGGIFRAISNSLVGTLVEDFIRSSVHVDKMFLSAGGIDLEDGVTNGNIIEVSIKRAMIEASKKVILAITHDKVNKRSFAPVVRLDKIDTLVTDSGADRDYLDLLRMQGVEVIVAE